MIRNRTILLAVAAAVLGGPRVSAVKYEPAPEETLSHVALVHYGDPNKYVYLVAPNGIVDPNRLPKGRSLWVPTVLQYRVKKGDTLAEIANRYLKDPAKADFLAWLNRVKDAKSLNAGLLLTIPFVIRHRVEAGQSMVDVAKRYYLRPQPASLLRRFNDRRTNALKEGETILVPIFDQEAMYSMVRERVEKYRKQQAEAAREVRKMAAVRPTEGESGEKQPAPAALAERLLEKPTQPTAPEQLILMQKGIVLYREGEFELSRNTLAEVLERGGLQPAEEAEARATLASCLVALEKPKEAEHEFVRLLMVAPDFKPDPIETSPKILEIFRRAKGGY